MDHPLPPFGEAIRAHIAALAAVIVYLRCVTKEFWSKSSFHAAIEHLSSNATMRGLLPKIGAERRY